MAGKSILEQALLQVETLEEAVKANAKGILQSTMKEELNNLLKEQEDNDPEEEEKDVEGATTPEDSDDTSISDEKPDEDETPEDSEEIPTLDNEKPGDEFNDEEPDNDADDVLDMTGASEEEVLKVFKAMKPEDGIVVKKDGNTVQFSDEGNDYIIKLEDEGEPEGGLPGLPSGEEGGEELPGAEGGEELPDAEGGSELPDEEEDEFGGLAEQSQPTDETDEVVYEIELDEEDEDQPFTEKAPKGKKTETKENVALPTKAPNKSEPFDKAGTSQGAKLRAKEVKEQEVGVDKWSGTPLKGTANPETKEPGKGGSKTTQAEKFEGTPVKGTKPAATKEPGKGGSKTTQAEKFEGTPVKGTGKPVMKEPKEEECKECGDNKVEATEAARTKSNPHGNKPKDGPKRAGLPSKQMWKAGSTVEAGDINEEVEILRKQNGEYKKALILFKDKLNEVAVFNANLAYATRLFTEHSTTKQEKLDILKRFDSISTINESKTLYTSIKGELDTKKPLSESAAEKIASTPASSATEMLSEAKAYENPQFKRMKELMIKIK